MTTFTTTTKTIAPRVRVVAIVDAAGRTVASTPVVLSGFCDEHTEILVAVAGLARTAGITAF